MAVYKHFLLLVVSALLCFRVSEHEVPAAGPMCTKVAGVESYACDSLGLNAIPDSLPSTVQDLDFSFNIMFDIYQSTFSRLHNLTKLDLTRCRINWVFENAFQSNPDLNTLILTGNPLLYVGDSAFQGPAFLQHLDLTQTGISSLTFFERHNLERLQTLHLKSNHITSLKLPESFPIKSLRYLDLQLNSIHTIAANDVTLLKQATNLSLSLKGNAIRYIEPASFNSSTFYSLDFGGCANSVYISVILNGLMGVNTHNLRIGSFFDVDNLGIYPDTLEGLCSITTQEVSLQNMEFRGLNSSIYRCLSNIMKLDLTSCDLDWLPPVVRSNSQLTEFTLNKNTFTNACDMHLDSFPLITHLNVKGNSEILDLGDGCFEKLSKLQHLDLSQSSISTPDCCTAQLRGLKSLRHLNLSYNNDHTLQDVAFQDNINLELLDFASTDLNISFIQGPFRNLQYLRMLNLSRCQINTSNRDLLTGLKSLVLLNLNQNSFFSGHIQSDNLFQQVPNLEILMLSACDLVAIDNDAFRALKKLKYVYLDHNKLTVFSSSMFIDLHHIVLNFSHNEIKMIPRKMLEGISGQSIIDLSYNPLDCTCANVEFHAWVLENKDKMDNLEETLCSSPETLMGKRLDMVTLSCGIQAPLIVLIVLLSLVLILICALIIRYYLKRHYQSI